MDEGCCRPLGEAESAFFSKESLMKKYEPFKILIGKRISTEKLPYLEDFLREAEISRGEKVLEIGINPAYLAVYLSKIVGDKGKVVLAELDEMITADAKRNIERHKAHNIVEVTEAKVEKLPFDPNSFDIVVSDRTTSLLKHKSTLIKEMARVLKAGGKLVIADCILRKPFTKSQVQQFRQNFACVFQAATVKDYVKLLENSGFKDVKIIIFMDEECVRPHSKIEDQMRGHLGFAIISAKKIGIAQRARNPPSHYSYS